MAKLFFDVEVFGLVQVSAEAEDFSNLTIAIAAAKERSLQMVAEKSRTRGVPNHGSLLIRDEAGQILHRISFLEAEVLVRSRLGSLTCSTNVKASQALYWATMLSLAWKS